MAITQMADISERQRLHQNRRIPHRCLSKIGRMEREITDLTTLKETKARIYSTQNAAKLAAFDGMIWLKSR
ncbi:MAG: hypothetical protein GKR94_07910 [Gammaproteobacteria bacterium]|nr:hypothetical protein [Gammaproteobacteria bacterium]